MMSDINRRDFLKTVGFGAVTLGLSGLGAKAQELPRPNIILLMGDDHGWEETGYHGHPHV